jgi:molecular chaperone DnaK
MSRTTIDFGIDLGTTNSAVAMFTGAHGQPTKIIKNSSTSSDVTPSVVYINKKGDVLVGQRALNRSGDVDQDRQTAFKRRMGSDDHYRFKSSGQVRTPEELSAEVLKSLRNDVQHGTGEWIDSAVITVPAAFELHQCDATRRAGQLAGFKETPLLQEPVAAALAYGFNVDEERAYWLVFDFGGGTFDAAIIKSEEGTIRVVHHAGDPFLGGSDIDRAIVDKLIAPRAARELGLSDFVRGNPKWIRAFNKLDKAAETAKIELSQNERTTLDTCQFNNDSGEEIEFECELKRGDVVSLAEPFILRAVEMSKRVLREKRLGESAIGTLILVGGPTLAPYFRDLLTVQLGIPLNHSVDPMTVVASGAALFAGARRLTPSVLKPIAVGEYRLELAKSFKFVGIETEPTVGGTVSGSTPQDFTGFCVEFVNTKTLWRSRRVPLKADGVFVATLFADQGERNVFAIELYNTEGRRLSVQPDTLTYTVGAGGDVEQPVINSVGLALANNERVNLFKKGQGLPLRVTIDCHTIQPMRHGHVEDVLRIPIVEGEEEKADRNRLNGALEIRGNQISRDVPVGTDFEVTVKIDESRILTVSAYIPLLDEEFEAQIEMKRHQPDAAQLQEEYEAEMARFHEVKSKAGTTGGQTAERLVEEVEASPLAQDVRETLDAAKADPTAALQGEKRLLEFKLRLDKVADALEWPTLVQEAREWLGHLQNVVDQHGNPQQKQRAEALSEEVETIVRERKPDRLRKRVEQIAGLYYELVMAQPGWWVYQFQSMEAREQEMSDPVKAGRLLGQGRDCLAKNNVTGLQTVTRQLWDLLPSGTVEAAKRGYGSTIMRR